MSVFDSIVNRAGDMARAGAANLEAVARRRHIQDQIAAQEATLRRSRAQLGRLAVDAYQQHGRPLPESVAPAGQEVLMWRAELESLHAELRRLDSALAETPPANGA